MCLSDLTEEGHWSIGGGVRRTVTLCVCVCITVQCWDVSIINNSIGGLVYLTPVQCFLFFYLPKAIRYDGSAAYC